MTKCITGGKSHVHINDQGINDEPHVPFAGAKYHTAMGRYNSDIVMDTLTELEWICLQVHRRDSNF